MVKSKKSVLAILLALTCLFAFMPLMTSQSYAAKKVVKVKITKRYHTANKTFNVKQGGKYTLRVNVTPKNKKIVWTKSNSKVTLPTVGEDSVLVKFKKAGKVNVTAAVKGTSKKVTWKFNIKAKKKAPKAEITAVAISADNAKEEASKKVTVGEILRANVTPADATASYQWQADGVDISGATGQSFTVTTDQIGKKITVKVAGTGNFKGNVASVETAKVDEVKLVGPMTVKAGKTNDKGEIEYNTPATSVNVGSPLKATVSDIDDLAGAAAIQWYRVTTSANGSAIETPISGANAATYTVQKEDIGTTLKVVATPNTGVTATGLVNGKYSATTGKVTGNITVEVQANGKEAKYVAANTALTAVVTPSDAAVTYQWYDADKNIAIAGATSATYTPTASGTYRVAVTTTNAETTYTKGTVLSGDVVVGSDKLGDIVLKYDDKDITAKTVIASGKKLTASVRVLGGTTNEVNYQWYKNNEKIEGATSADYTLENAKIGEVYKVVATGKGKYSGSSVETSVTIASLGSINDAKLGSLKGAVTYNPVKGTYVLNVKGIAKQDKILNTDYAVEFFKNVKTNSNGAVTPVSLGKASSTEADTDSTVKVTHELTNTELAVSDGQSIDDFYAIVTAPNYTGEQKIDFGGLDELDAAAAVNALDDAELVYNANDRTLKAEVTVPSGFEASYNWTADGVEAREGKEIKEINHPEKWTCEITLSKSGNTISSKQLTYSAGTK